MALYVVTIAIEVEDSFKGRKPDDSMIISYLENRVKSEPVRETLFRKKIILNILEVNFSVMSWKH